MSRFYRCRNCGSVVSDKEAEDPCAQCGVPDQFYRDDAQREAHRSELTKSAKLALIYRHTHNDYKGKDADGVRRVLVLREGGTHSVPLDALTDAEIADKLPNALRKQEIARLGRPRVPLVSRDALETVIAAANAWCELVGGDVDMSAEVRDEIAAVEAAIKKLA